MHNKALMTATVIVIFQHFYNGTGTFNLDTIGLCLECPGQGRPVLPGGRGWRRSRVLATDKLKYRNSSKNDRGKQEFLHGLCHLTIYRGTWQDQALRSLQNATMSRTVARLISRQHIGSMSVPWIVPITCRHLALTPLAINSR